MLAYDRRGNGPPVVLVHHLGGTRSAWDLVRDALAERHDTIAVDVPGFGASPPLAGPPTVPALTDAVGALLADLALEPPAVAGVSLGGAIALELAARGAVRCATVISPVGFATPREQSYARWSLRGTLALSRRLRPVLPAMCATAPARMLLGGQIYGRPWRVPAAEMAAAAEDLGRAPSSGPAIELGAGWRARPVDARVPVTVIWGTRDRLLLPRQARRAQRLIPHARIVRLAGCGHLPFHDDPAAVAAALAAGAAA